MCFTFLTHHTDEIVHLLECGVSAYINDKDDEIINELSDLVQDIFDHEHFSTQLTLHRYQAAICLGLSSFQLCINQSMHISFVMLCLYSGVTGLISNYEITVGNARQTIEHFITELKEREPYSYRDRSYLFTQS